MDPTIPHWMSRNFLRLALPLAALAIPLAFASLAIQVAAGITFGALGVGPYAFWPMVLLFLYAHGIFIITLTDWGMQRLHGTALIGAALAIAAKGGLAVAAVLALGLLPLLLGPVFGLPVPHAIADAPWIVILWAVASFLALPARIAAWLRGEPLVLAPPLHRLLHALPWLLVVELFGYPAQSCTGECWGLFEGGMVMLPLLGLHLFTASFSTALLSAAASLAPTVHSRVET